MDADSRRRARSAPDSPPAAGSTVEAPGDASVAEVAARGPTAEHIAERAAELFACKGFAATSIREIADAAGVTKPTLYYHFGSKEGLVRHIHDSVNAVFAAQVEDLEREGLPLAATLERLASALFCYADSHPAVVQLLLRLQHLPAGESLIGDLRAVQERNLAMLGHVFGRAAARGDVAPLDPEFLALSYLGALSAHVLHRVHVAPAARPDPALGGQHFARLFLQGASPPADAATSPLPRSQETTS